MAASPKIFASLRDYNLQTFLSDLVAGITAGLVALPLAMAGGTAKTGSKHICHENNR